MPVQLLHRCTFEIEMAGEKKRKNGKERRQQQHKKAK